MSFASSTPWDLLVQVVAHAIYASLSDATRSSGGGVSGASGGASGGLHLGEGAVGGTKRKFYDVNDSSSSSRGLASVLLTTIAPRGWVREDELASELGLGKKQVAKALVMLEQDQCVLRESAIRNVPMEHVAGAAPTDEAPVMVKRTLTYCRVDHAHFADVINMRIHLARTAAAGGDINASASEAAARADASLCFVCNNCGSRYEGYEAADLFMDAMEANPTCPRCGADVEEASATQAAAAAPAAAGADATNAKDDSGVMFGLLAVLERCLERCRMHGSPPPFEPLSEYMRRMDAEKRRRLEAEQHQLGLTGAAGRGAGRGDLWRAAAQAGGLKADDAEVKVELLTENMPEEAPVEAGGKQATDDNDDVGWEADVPAAVGDASEWDAGGDDDEWE